jgi:dolichol-phosphate mannosyltransferase
MSSSKGSPTAELYSVILPTYNERENLPLIVCMIDRAFCNIDKKYEIIIVEDSSPDGTIEAAKQLQTIYGADKIVIHSRPGKMGLGSAYIDGLTKCKGNFIFLMDADMSHHPKFIQEFIRVQQSTGCDVVTGTRYAHGGGVAGWDVTRVLMSRGANLLANLLLNTGVSDLTGVFLRLYICYMIYYPSHICYIVMPVCIATILFYIVLIVCLTTGSFRLYKREVFDDLIRCVKGKTYVFQMEIILRAISKGYTLKEVRVKRRMKIVLKSLRLKCQC